MRWIFAMMLAACSGDTPTTGNLPLSPDEVIAQLRAPGPYRVGYDERALTYVDPFGQPRALRLAWWYPTNATAGSEVAYQGIFPAPEVLFAPPRAPGAFPLAVFSHGHQGYAESSGRIISHLVSHGITVLAPDHTGNTTFDSSDRDALIYAQRPADISAVLDFAESQLAGAIRVPYIGIGHSFGGYTLHGATGATYDVDAMYTPCVDGTQSRFCTTWTPEVEAVLTAGFTEPRFSALVSMAPGDWRAFGAGLATVAPRVLLMTGELDTAVGADAAPIWRDLAGEHDLWISLPRGSHQSFGDFANALSPVEGELEREVGWDILQTYTLAWIRAADSDTAVKPLLDGSATFTDEAVRTARGD